MPSSWVEATTGYAAAWPCLALMFLYPVHQSLGQIQGTYFFASGQTGTYTRIGIVLMALSIPVTYLVVAPAASPVPGLSLGALGLALKMVVLQIVGVNIQAAVIDRANGWAPDYAHQALVLGGFAALGWLCKWAGQSLAGASPAAVMALGSILYAVVSGAVVLRRPQLVGVEDARGRFLDLAAAVLAPGRRTS